MADISNCYSQKLKKTMDNFVKVGLRQRRNWINKTLTKKGSLVNVGKSIIALIILSVLVMMSR